MRPNAGEDGRDGGLLGLIPATCASHGWAGAAHGTARYVFFAPLYFPAPRSPPAMLLPSLARLPRFRRPSLARLQRFYSPSLVHH